RQNVKQALFQAASFVALPIFVVIIAEVNDVFARDISWSAGRSEHLALHAGFNLARNLYEKFFPLPARPRMFFGFFQNVVGGFTINPTADGINQAHRESIVNRES